MYAQSHNRVDDWDTMFAFMREHSFATLVTAVGGAPRATHLPFLVERRGEDVVLSAHMAKANPQWRDMAEATEALVVFSGPHAYVSPRYYERVESVPTWNYVAVHAYGAFELVDGEAAKLDLVERLTREHDDWYSARWAELSDDFKRSKLKGIVAFEIPVARLEGRWKLSQDRTRTERERIASALVESRDSAAADCGALMLAGLRADAGA